MDADQSSLTLTILDTSGIQPYIFGANSLKQSIGASELVRWATEDAVRAALLEVCGADGVNVDKKERIAGRYLAFPPQGGALTPGLKAEWLNAGGGNTLLLFANMNLAKSFASTLSLKLFDEAPGLNLVVAHHSLNMESVLADEVDAIIKIVNRKKLARGGNSPLLGLGVTASCQFTGLPAGEEYLDKDDSDNLLRVSTEVVKKRSTANKSAQQRLQEMLQPQLGEKYTLLLNFDDLGVKGETSFMGVVHIDGNGMGKRVQRVADQYRTVEQNREYIKAIRTFSEKISATSEQALQETIQALIDKVNAKDFEEKHGRLRHKEGKTILPFRPIVFGGDDITFVCDGRLALSLAHRYMEALEAKPLADGDKLYVRGGIAVVKSHYPFARAYEIAEDLAKSAKKLINRHKPSHEPYARFSAMDWHFAATGLVLDLEEIRRREYTVSTGELTMRPVLIHAYENVIEWRRWDNLSSLIEQFSCDPWDGKRNKIKALREILREGPDKTTLFIEALGERHALKAIDGDEKTRQSGWYGERCAWADAIEALDLFIPITAKTASTTSIEQTTQSTAPGGDA